MQFPSFGVLRVWMTPHRSAEGPHVRIQRAFQLFAHGGYFSQNRLEMYCSDMNANVLTRIQAHHSFRLVVVEGEVHRAYWRLCRRVPHCQLLTYGYFCDWFDALELVRSLGRAGRL